jgi:transposase-like protein
MSSKKLSSTKFQTQSKYNRYFSEDFKRQKVKELEEKQVTVKQLCDLYKVSRTSVYKWLYKYSPHQNKGTKLVIQMESESTKTKRLLNQVSELERIVGQKQLQIDILEKTLSVASEEVGYDLKKKYGPKSLNTFGNTEKS